jgi:uncharacterized protein (TIGR00290 family)
MKKTAAYINWSGGKDSALCLYKVLKEDKVQVRYLLTSINKVHGRISMHGVRTDLLRKQAASIGIPLKTIELPEQPDMAEYERIMTAKVKELLNEGIHHTIFGDIFLEDLRKYREDQLRSLGITASFPLWKISTKELMDEFIDLGFKAIIVCVNEKFLDKSFCGRMIDRSFINDLPDNVDVCGENGEYHSFVFDGPIFKTPILFEKGEIVYRQYAKPKNATDISHVVSEKKDYGFYFFDLLPVVNTVRGRKLAHP